MKPRVSVGASKKTPSARPQSSQGVPKPRLVRKVILAVGGAFPKTTWPWVKNLGSKPRLLGRYPWHPAGKDGYIPCTHSVFKLLWYFAGAPTQGYIVGTLENNGYSFWNPSKWKQGRKLAVPSCFNLDPYPLCRKLSCPHRGEQKQVSANGSLGWHP